MFKKTFAAARFPVEHKDFPWRRGMSLFSGGQRFKSIILVTSVFFLLFSVGCRTLPPLPAVNLAEPGWTIREGQGVWRPKREAPEIAGEILAATHRDARAFVQFTKTPFPFVIATTTTNSWQIEFPTQNKRYSGLGKPPSRLLWLQLPRAISGAAPPKPWSWQPQKEHQWRLENLSTGESLQGFFNQ